LALVGESGSGKSVTCLAVLGLLAANGSVSAGAVLFEDENLVAASARRLNDLRGRDITMVFQDPAASLNPVHTIGRQIIEAIQLHEAVGTKAAQQRAEELLREVGMPDPAARLRYYPHQLSGGMAQRAMIAMALACRPRLLIADEPTTALDVTIQAQILDLLRRVRDDLQMGLLLITHDLGVVAEMADDVAVMYAGRVVETGPVHDIFASPRHPYTRGLIASTPRFDRRIGRLHQINGSVPAPNELVTGCRFAGRCDQADSLCHREEPALRNVSAGRLVACHHLMLEPA
jgi:oligopeptide/dipeptide ABC transporter ATP-binding protein